MKLDNVIAVRKNKTVYRDGNLTIKVFNSSYSKADILNEALNQARVEETKLHIPKIHEVTVIDGKWAIVADYIEGKTLDELMAENPDKIDEYLDLFVNLQTTVLKQSCQHLKRLKDKMKAKIAETSFDADVKYELSTRLDSMPNHQKLCHGDFNPSNIVISAKDGTPYILDWSHATLGNASADAARTYLLFCLEGKREIADKYLDMFCKKNDTAKKYVQKWMPIVAASQSVKKNKKERDFLANWVNVVEY